MGRVVQQLEKSLFLVGCYFLNLIFYTIRVVLRESQFYQRPQGFDLFYGDDPGGESFINSLALGVGMFRYFTGRAMPSSRRGDGCGGCGLGHGRRGKMEQDHKK
jgi:hypothetical protein